MDRHEAEEALRGVVRSGIPDPRLELGWIDWRKGEGGGRNEGRYSGAGAEVALVDFRAAFDTIPEHELRVEVAEQSPPRLVSREVQRIPERPRGSWGIENYNTFLREAKRAYGVSHREAQELYRQAKAATGRSLVGADVRRLSGTLAYETARIRSRDMIDVGWELELTATTTGDTPRRRT